MFNQIKMHLGLRDNDISYFFGVLLFLRHFFVIIFITMNKNRKKKKERRDKRIVKSVLKNYMEK